MEVTGRGGWAHGSHQGVGRAAAAGRVAGSGNSRRGAYVHVAAGVIMIIICNCTQLHSPQSSPLVVM